MTQSTINDTQRHSATQTGDGASGWSVRPEASRAGFRVRKMGIYFVRGRFRTVEGAVELDADSTPVSGWLKVDASSISTRMPPRDLHLRSHDFLEVARYPEILVRADHVITGDNRSFDIDATVSIKGIERRVALRGHLERGDAELRQLHLYGRIDRHDFAITPRRPFEWVVGRQVQLEAVLVLEPAER